eukprot:m.314441 g.314441  ORF g.314441 m.314441 type:complete len:52 (+) comp524729_c0_seq1:52-207(+)
MINILAKKFIHTKYSATSSPVKPKVANSNNLFFNFTYRSNRVSFRLLFATK